MTLQVLLLAASEGAEEKAPPVIDIDGTVLLQFGIFLAMFFVLSEFLWKPYLKMRTERAHRIEGAEKTAAEAAARAEQLEREFKEKMGKARQSAEEERLRLSNEGRLRETELLASARDRAQSRVRATREQVNRQVEQAQAELLERADGLSRLLAGRLLGREV
ncbi:MAG TPA: ATP synthase F0 subunit B [Pseudomonadota bacterium]|jgi:F0F1-type ATP synthase membrane subunit b/b'|nr:ATP synthase F0 subunit B [Pseudomonadota bacterium]